MELFLIFIIAVLIITVGIYFHTKAVKAFKKNVVKVALEKVIPGAEYLEMDGFGEERIRETRLVRRSNRFNSTDYIRGVYHGLEFEFANVNISDHRSAGKSSYTVEYFRGQWLIIKPHVTLDTELYIVDKRLYHSDPDAIGWFDSRGLTKVETESIAFNKEFKVHASDPVNAFYILSPQKILSLYENEAQDVSVYLNKDELHIAIYSGSFIFGNEHVNEENRESVENRIIDELIKTLGAADILK